MNSQMKVNVNTTRPANHCAFCQEGLSDQISVCQLCNTAVHHECFQELNGCVSLGCPGDFTHRDLNDKPGSKAEPRIKIVTKDKDAASIPVKYAGSEKHMFSATMLFDLPINLEEFNQYVENDNQGFRKALISDFRNTLDEAELEELASDISATNYKLQSTDTGSRLSIKTGVDIFNYIFSLFFVFILGYMPLSFIFIGLKSTGGPSNTLIFSSILVGVCIAISLAKAFDSFHIAEYGRVKAKDLENWINQESANS